MSSQYALSEQMLIQCIERFYGNHFQTISAGFLLPLKPDSFAVPENFSSEIAFRIAVFRASSNLL